MTITFRPSPMQALIDYILSAYLNLDPFCLTLATSVGTDHCVQCCSGSYYNQGRAIQYQCKNSKRVYLIRYLASQVKQVQFAIDSSVLETIGARQTITLASLGGGPGTEVIAMMDTLRNTNNQHALDFDSFEIEPSWKPIFDDLTTRFAQRMPNLTLRARFRSHNVSGGIQALTNQYDVVFVSWLLSELADQGRITVLGRLAQLLKSDGLAVIADRPEASLISRVNQIIAGEPDLMVVESDTQTEHCGVTFPNDVRTAYQVKLWANTHYWVLQAL
jgi:hypothetical protein